jgi:glucose/arabinose dehydrogenase
MSILMKKNGRNLGASLCGAAILMLGACGGGSGSGNFNPPPPPPGGATIATQRAFSQLSFTQPVAMIQAPNIDTRWYVVERAGIIRVFDNDPNVMQSTVFANLTGIVSSTSGGETGLLGLAFHPDFANNNEVYVSYTAAPGGVLTSRLSRFTANVGGLTLNTASEQVLLSLTQPASNHNGGEIAFGPDGSLYAGWGDGGGSGDPQNNGQNRHNLFGTIIRIDVDNGVPYGIPATNRYVGNPLCAQGVGGDNCPEIFAWGFRNPWRWSFDSLTGILWVGDVGQGNWEEIDRVEFTPQIDMNFGWNVREGAHCFNPPSACATNSVDPITEYSHAVGISVTGGYVYRGMAIAGLQGTYIFGDYGSGRIWGVAENSMQGTAPDELLDSTHSISSFGEDLDGELYLLDYGSGFIYQIVAAP